MVTSEIYLDTNRSISLGDITVEILPDYKGVWVTTDYDNVSHRLTLSGGELYEIIRKLTDAYDRIERGWTE